MTCDDLDPFFDGELVTAEAHAFREHLVTCARCQAGLHSRIQEAMLLPLEPDRSERDEPLPVTPIARPNRRRAPIALFGSAAAAAVVLAVAVSRPLPDDRLALGSDAVSAELKAALDKQRRVDVRFSDAALDDYRPLAVERAAGPPPSEEIGVQILSRLDTARRTDALIGARALAGDLASAAKRARARIDEQSSAEHPGHQPRTARAMSDLSAIELLGVRGDGDPAQQSARLLHALSLASAARALEPGLAQASWNRALALGALGLPQLAADAFDELARRNEPGWSTEARDRAEGLRRGQDAEARRWAERDKAAQRMILGGPPLALDDAARTPSFARDQLYQAIATAATRARLDELAPLATALDDSFATTAMTDLVHRIARSDLAQRAPLAARLHDALALASPRDALVAVRGRAIAQGVPDIALAAFLALGDRGTRADDLEAIAPVTDRAGDPWWQLVRIARGAYLAEFIARDPVAVEGFHRRAAPLCEASRSAWCGRITRLAAGANSQMGRMELALGQFIEAQQRARRDGTDRDERAALYALGEALAIWFSSDIDAAAVSAAFLEEVALERPSCETRLFRLDFETMSALRYHRLDDAEQAQLAADQLEHGECNTESPRLNQEIARVQLLLQHRSTLGALRASIERLARDATPIDRRYIALFEAVTTLLGDRTRGQAALRQIIASADADLHQPGARDSRGLAYDVLIDDAAALDGPDAAHRVLGLMTQRLDAPAYDRCVLGIASWNRRIIGALDARGEPHFARDDIPPGQVMIAPALAVPRAILEPLADCPRVEVLAPGPYFGAAGLLGDKAPWVYHSGGVRPAAAPGPRKELVISDVAPPDRLRLPALRAFDAGDADVLRGPDATPDRVLAHMRAANLIVVVAHGVTDASEPNAASLVLSPDARGDYLLTAAKVSAAQLTGAPIVVLAGCDAGRVQPGAEPWSLATSFIRAGARMVIAPTAPIPDGESAVLFQSLVARIRRGEDPIAALSDERRHLTSVPPWLSSIVVFE